MFETVLQYLQWAFPYGLGTAIGWLVSSALRSARTAREVHDTYKAMYEDVSREMQELRNENEKLYKAFVRLERAVSRAITCRYWPDCPIRGELPESKVGGVVAGKQRRQNRDGPHRIRDSGDGGAGRSRRQRKPDNSNGEDTESARGSDVHEETGPDACQSET